MLGLLLGATGLLQPARAQPSPPGASAAGEAKIFDVPAGPLDAALDRFARIADVRLSYDKALVSGLTTRGVAGGRSVAAALSAILAGSGLEAVAQPSGGYALRKAAAASPQADEAASSSTLPVVVVTGQQERNAAEPFAGGQVASGGRVGLLGDRNVFETPFNITSFTAQTIVDKQAVRLADIGRLDPSVQVVSSSSLYQDEFLVRGFRVTQSSVAFDGTPGMTPNYGVGSLQAVERVEIFKGANTLLNGVATGLSAGGYINLVPKRATERPVTQLNASFVSDSTFIGHADIGRRFGPDNAFGARLNLAVQDGDAAFDDASEKRRLGALALDYRGDRLRVVLDAGHHVQNTRAAPYSFYADAGIELPRVPGPGRNVAQRWSFSDTTTDYARLKAEYDLGRDVTVWAVHGGHRSTYYQSTPYGLLHDGSGNFEEAFANGDGIANVRTSQVGLDANVTTGPLRHRVSLVTTRIKHDYRFYAVFDAAGGGQDPSASNLYDPVRLPEPSFYFRPLGDLKPSGLQHFPSTAIADTVSAWNERLQLTLGLRRQRIDFTQYDYNGLGTVIADYDENATTPVIALLFKATDRISLYANRIESLDQGPSSPLPPFTNLPPVRNKQTEVGAKIDFGALAVTTDYFDIQQPIGRLNADQSRYALDGEQRNRGVELNVFGKPWQSVRLNGGAAWIDAIQRKTQDGAFDGKRASGVSKVNVAASAEWDFAPGWTLTGGGRFNGPAYVDAGNTLRVGGYAVFDLGLRYVTHALAEGMTVRAGVTNVANRAYFAADPFGGIFQGTPRVVTVSATVDF